MLLNIFSNLWERFSNWGVGQVYSIIISLLIIGASLPFTYVGYSVRKAITYSIKKYEGYGVRKIRIHAIVSSGLLIVLETILYLTLDISKFYGVSLLLGMMIFLGLLGIKLTFDLEGLIDSWFEDAFKKE